MEQKDMSELERILQITVEDLGRQVSELNTDLKLARAQIQVMKQAEAEVKVRATDVSNKQ